MWKFECCWICNPTCCSKSSANAKKLIPWSFHRRMYSSSMTSNAAIVMVSKVSMMVLIVSTSDVVMLGDSKIWQPPHVYVRGGLAGALSPFQLGRHTHTHGSLRNFASCPEKNVLYEKFNFIKKFHFIFMNFSFRKLVPLRALVFFVWEHPWTTKAGEGGRGV